MKNNVLPVLLATGIALLGCNSPDVQSNTTASGAWTFDVLRQLTPESIIADRYGLPPDSFLRGGDDPALGETLLLFQETISVEGTVYMIRYYDDVVALYVLKDGQGKYVGKYVLPQLPAGYIGPNTEKTI